MSVQLWALLVILGWLVFATRGVHAEGCCLPGQYPVGGQGMLGCAPIPGYASGAPTQDDYKRPRGKWKITWGGASPGRQKIESVRHLLNTIFRREEQRGVQ